MKENSQSQNGYKSPSARFRASTHDIYINGAHNAEFLDADTERKLALAWRDQKDESARERLILAHMRSVAAAARQYLGYGIPENDLVSTGTVGLLKAADKYDPDHASKARFQTCADTWINSEIKDYILKNAYPLKGCTTKDTRKAFFKLRSMKMAMGVNGRSLRTSEIEQIASKLKITPESVKSTEIFLNGTTFHSVERKLSHEPDSATFGDIIPSSAPPPDHAVSSAQQLKRAVEAFKQLSPREQDVLTRRRLVDEPKTLYELADEYGVSGERIRQIETSATKKLRQAMAGSALELAELTGGIAGVKPEQSGLTLPPPHTSAKAPRAARKQTVQAAPV